jgi:signal transduction histidine kinase
MHRKWILTSSFFLFCSFTLLAQLNTDSLIDQLSIVKEDTQKVNIYRMLAGIIGRKDPRKAVEYGKTGVALGKQTGFNKGIAGCYLNISSAYSNASKPDSALYFIDSAIIYSHIVGDNNRLALVYLNRADYYMQLRNLKQSLLDCDTALKYAALADNNDRRARVLQTIGSVYYIQELYPRSIEYYEKAGQLYQQIGNRQMSAIVLNNMGNAHKHLGEHELAVSKFNQAIRIADSIEDKANMAMYYGNLSDVYIEAGDHLLAEQAASRSLDHAREMNNEMQQAHALSYFGRLFLKQKKYPQAIEAGTTSLALAQKHNDISWQYAASEILAEAYASSLDHSNAYKYVKLGKELNDSLLRARYDEDLASMQTIFRVNEKNNEILLLNKDKQLQKQRITQQQFFMAGAIALAILSFVGIGLLISRNRLRQNMKELKIRNQIAADLHDEVGSSLSSIHMLSELAAKNNFDEAKQQDILSKVSTYSSETMDRMGDIVWMIKPDDKEGAGIKDRMERYFTEMCNSKGIHPRFEGRIMDKVKLTMQEKKEIYLVFKEAVNNAVRHSGAKNISAEFIQEAGRITLVVEDDGKGFETSITKNGNGLENMQNRAKELKADLKIEAIPGRGTKISLSVPLTN